MAINNVVDINILLLTSIDNYLSPPFSHMQYAIKKKLSYSKKEHLAPA